jgi:hypothetical protein
MLRVVCCYQCGRPYVVRSLRWQIVVIVGRTNVGVTVWYRKVGVFLDLLVICS